MKLESNQKRKPIRATELLSSAEEPAFEFRPEREFTGADVQAVVMYVLELLQTDWTNSFQAAYLTNCIFPEVTPELRETVKAKVQEYKRELVGCLSDGSRKDNAEKFFYAYLAELAVRLPGETPILQSAWEARGKEAAKAKLEYVTFQKAWGVQKSDFFHLNGIALLSLPLFDIPELRDMVAGHLRQSRNAQGVSFGEALEKRVEQPISGIFDVELRALRRVWLAYQGDMTAGMLSAGEVEQAYQIFKSFKESFRLDGLQGKEMLRAARSLMLLTAPRLAFPHDGIVQPMPAQPLTKHSPLPERLKL